MTADQLRELYKAISEEVPPRRRGDYGYVNQVRALTQQEWENLLIDLRACTFTTVLGTTDFGFALGISMFDAPAAPGLNPEHLITISQKQIPVEALQAPTLGEPRAAYDLLYPLVSLPKNTRALEAFGLEQPKSFGYYTY